MGCDIHVHTEVKINGEWHHVGHPNIRRDYALFSKMADVCNDPPTENPIAQPRGMPEDAAFITLFDLKRMEVNAHSHSWLSGAEIDILDTWYKETWKKRNPEQYHYIEEQFGYLFGNGWNVQKYPTDRPAGIEDARWIFWFDN